jgi:hypothetical protein
MKEFVQQLITNFNNDPVAGSLIAFILLLVFVAVVVFPILYLYNEDKKCKLAAKEKQERMKKWSRMNAERENWIKGIMLK